MILIVLHCLFEFYKKIRSWFDLNWMLNAKDINKREKQKMEMNQHKKKEEPAQLGRTRGNQSGPGRIDPTAQHTSFPNCFLLSLPLTGGAHLSAPSPPAVTSPRDHCERPWLNPIDSGSESLPRLRLFNPRTPPLCFPSPSLV
jgi:hypothetical protein